MELVFFPVVTVLRRLLFLYHSQVSVATSLLQYLATHIFVVLFILFLSCFLYFHVCILCSPYMEEIKKSINQSLSFFGVKKRNCKW